MLSLLFVCFGLAASQCLTAPFTGSQTVQCNGIRYIFSVPPQCASGCGIIFDTHGMTMSGDSQDESSNLRELGNAAGWVVVNPEEPGASWFPTTHHPYLEAFLRETVEVFRSDRAHVHWTGFSQGGYSSWMLLCRASDIVCSIGPLAASGLDSWGSGYGSNCFEEGGPRIPRSVFYTTGTEDPLALFIFAPIQVENVKDSYGMTGDGDLVQEDRDHRWVRWQNSDGIVFEYMHHDYHLRGLPVAGGHCFPTLDRDGGSGLWACPGAMNIGQEFLAIFQAHPCAEFRNSSLVA